MTQVEDLSLTWYLWYITVCRVDHGFLLSRLFRSTYLIPYAHSVYFINHSLLLRRGNSPNPAYRRCTGSVVLAKSGRNRIRGGPISFSLHFVPKRSTNSLKRGKMWNSEIKASKSSRVILRRLCECRWDIKLSMALAVTEPQMERFCRPNPEAGGWCLDSQTSQSLIWSTRTSTCISPIQYSATHENSKRIGNAIHAIRHNVVDLVAESDSGQLMVKGGWLLQHSIQSAPFVRKWRWRAAVAVVSLHAHLNERFGFNFFEYVACSLLKSFVRYTALNIVWSLFQVGWRSHD